MMVELSPKCLSTTQLVEESRKEIGHFLKQQATSNVYAFELFRRALLLRDEYAWTALYDLYKALVMSWILRSRRSAAASDVCERESLVNQAFARFARSVTPERFGDFHSVESLLAYLRSCARSAALDDLRSHRVLFEDPLEDLTVELYCDDPTEGVLSTMCFTHVLECIIPLLSDEQERVVFQEIIAGSRPHDIVAFHAHLFENVDVVYRIKRNVLERLRRNRDLKRVLREVA